MPKICHIELRALICALLMLFWIQLGNFWPDIYAHPIAWLGLVAGLALFIWGLPRFLIFIRTHAAKLRRFCTPAILGATIAFVFAILVACGVTGSSLELGAGKADFLDCQSIHLFGNAKPIRSDEWSLFTPLALAQANHHPAFPVINRNLGVEGQNMLILGMSGMPVAHISALAKPATWGFFLFDQRRALAWYWWFPIFGSLLALWGVFTLLIQRRHLLTLALAAWFCLSAYSAVWSHWPLYAVFFPSAALCALMAILRGQPLWRLACLSVMLGLALAGFLFFLYPPWQIPVAWLYLPLAIALIAREKLYLQITFFKLATLGLALAIAGMLAWFWWSDAREAVLLMLNTVYPGRRVDTGGHTPIVALLRGITNLVALYRLQAPCLNQSEIISFVYLFAPLLAAIITNFRTNRFARMPEAALLLTAGFALIFMTIGIPKTLAQWSLWGMTTERRADLALGLAYYMLCGLAIGAPRGQIRPQPGSHRHTIMAHAIAVSWALFSLIILLRLPANISLGLSPGVAAVLFCAAWLGGVWLVKGNASAFLALNIGWSAMSSLTFNPALIAPRSIGITPQLQHELQAHSPNCARVLAIGNRSVTATFLQASGVATVNGVFYYPQFGFWRKFDPRGMHSEIYNRFHHLVFEIGVADYPNGVYACLPYPDLVRMVVDPQKFDFAQAGAQLLVAPAANEAQLRATAELKFIGRIGGQAWFKVEKDL